ncbi:hypothetical protein NLI96_g424 [Meripilus lineatus]|uniref:Uncharacterized protein n=1 Tax=Meripilus lineatus TaxID=2056292 RepID=A0AAD5VCL3_9APHY|nr:hypothetical protein NLI96_g424 [Physisporinus lineatus]
MVITDSRIEVELVVDRHSQQMPAEPGAGGLRQEPANQIVAFERGRPDAANHPHRLVSDSPLRRDILPGLKRVPNSARYDVNNTDVLRLWSYLSAISSYCNIPTRSTGHL